MGTKRIYSLGLPKASIFPKKVKVNERCAWRVSLAARPIRHEVIRLPDGRGAGDSAGLRRRARIG